MTSEYNIKEAKKRARLAKGGERSRGVGTNVGLVKLAEGEVTQDRGVLECPRFPGQKPDTVFQK